LKRKKKVYLVVVIHAHGDTRTLKVVNDQVLLLGTIGGSEDELQATGSIDNQVSGLVLITESVATQDNGLGPSRDQSGDVFAENGLTENGASQNVADGSLFFMFVLIRV
jgi:hypothetical protein